MKKLLLLMSAGCFALSAVAQQNNISSMVLKVDHTAQKGVPVIEPGTMLKDRIAASSANKTTGTGGARWFIPYSQGDAYLGGGLLDNNRFVFPFDWDSTLTQKFSTGYSPVNFISIAQFIDPIFSKGYHSTSYYDGTTIGVRGQDSYTVDSINFTAAYMIGTAGLTSTKDTLYLSVAPVPYADNIYSPTNPATQKAPVTNYTGVTAHGNQAPVQQLNTIDAANRQLAYSGAIKWKWVIPDTNRKAKTSTGQYPTRGYTLAVPGGLTVPAGQGFAISVAFKPGEPWNNGDSVQHHHYFMGLAAESADNAIMPYFRYDQNDRSMAYLRHYSATTAYLDALAYEIINDIQFGYEFLDLSGHVTCGTCWDLDVAKTSLNIDKMNAVPVPASSTVNISFSLKSAADVTVTLTNIQGQVVKTENAGKTAKGNVSFNVSDLANGVYFYTVNAEGQHITRRMVVNH